MPLSLQEWREKLTTRWMAWRDHPRETLNSLGANSLYFAVAGSALFPVAAALAHGDPAAQGLLVLLAGHVGGHLIANILQKGFDESALSKNLAVAAKEQPEIPAALDAILEELGAVSEIRKGMKKADLEWFRKTFDADRKLAIEIHVGPVTKHRQWRHRDRWRRRCRQGWRGNCRRLLRRP